MNWFFSRPPAPAMACDRVQPLLSLLADGMASRAECRRAQAHLETCADCRQAFAWMQATHDVLATRETADAPADLRIRCRRAWAAEETLSPLPRRVTPASRVSRPAFAAVMSLTVLGAVIGYYLAPAPPTLTKSIPARSVVAVKPTASVPARIIPHLHSNAMVAVQPHHPHISLPVPVPPVYVPSPNKIALLPPAPVKDTVRTVHHINLPDMIADSHPAPSVVKRLTTVPKTYAPKPLIADLPKPRLLTLAVPHSDASEQMATNKVQDTPPAAPKTEAPAQVAMSPSVTAPQTAGFVPHHADPLAAVRLNLPSLNEGGTRTIAMAGGVHFQPAFVQFATVYTPR